MRHIRNELSILEDTFSNYREDSEISRFNRAAVNEVFEPSEPFLEVISRMIRYHDLTGGGFDITLGRWTSPPDRKTEPMVLLEEFLCFPIDQRLEVKSNMIRRLHRDTVLDSGSFGKGVALQTIEKLIRNSGITSAFISFGGSSVLGVGSHPHGSAWKIGIQHPEDPEKTVGTIDLLDRSLSVSGNSVNNRKKFGEAGHVLNPNEGTFVNAPAQVAVSSPDPLEAEALSTAMFASLISGTQPDADRFANATFFIFNEK
jgi:thiamine biosynthesis lipoprotein